MKNTSYNEKHTSTERTIIMKTVAKKSLKFARRHAGTIAVGTAVTTVIVIQGRNCKSMFDFITDKELLDEYATFAQK